MVLLIEYPRRLKPLYYHTETLCHSEGGSCNWHTGFGAERIWVLSSNRFAPALACKWQRIIIFSRRARLLPWRQGYEACSRGATSPTNSTKDWAMVIDDEKSRAPWELLPAGDLERQIGIFVDHYIKTVAAIWAYKTSRLLTFTIGRLVKS